MHQLVDFTGNRSNPSVLDTPVGTSVSSVVEERNIEAIGHDHLADESDAKSELKQLRLKNINRIIVGYLNINSIRNNFDALKDKVSQNIDILMVAETKIDDFSPKEQFSMEGYSDPLWLDRDANGGGPLVYVRSDIPSTELKSFKFDNDVECVYSEINLRGRKWVIFSIYRTPSQPEAHFLKTLAKGLITTVRNLKTFCFLVTLMQWKQINMFVIL